MQNVPDKQQVATQFFRERIGRIDKARLSKSQSFRERGRRMHLSGILWDRWRSSVREVVVATLAALLAWVVVQDLLDHPNPMFAAVIALVSLAPGIPSHRKQAWGLVLGVATGIVVGEIVIFIPNPAVAMGIGLFVSMMIASSFNMGPVLPIQAGVSVLLMLTLGAETAGYIRMVDVLIGAVIGLMCGRFLLTPTTETHITGG